MSFAVPILLWLLAAPAAWLAWELLHRRKAAAAAHPHIMRAEAGIGRLTLGVRPAASPAGRAGRPRVLLCLGLACGVVALARPQWGRVDEPVFEQAREIVIALDLSRSMQTPDVKPTRLDRAKLLIQSLLEKLAGERVGLVSFAGTAFLQAPLSADYEILREFLPTLGPGFMPVGGTDYGALIDAAAGAFSSGSSADRYLIVLSDGGATDEDWRGHVAKLKEKGVRVIGLGVGTAAGALIPDGADGYVKDGNGAVVMSRLESDTLKELCSLTGGTYRDASQWIDLPRLLAATVDSGRKGKFTERNTARYNERYQWALAPALLLLLLSYYWDFPVRPKARDMDLAERGESKPAAMAAAAAAFLVILLAPSSFAAASADSSALLGRIVGRLSAEPSPNALDWMELGRQTLTWGQQLQTSGQAVPAGPVRDALSAVEKGKAIDRKAGDWDKLEDGLGQLLKKPEQKKPEQKDKQQKDQKKKQDQRQKSQQSGQSQQNQSSQQDQKSGQDKQSQQDQSSQQDQQSGQNGQQQQQSAFGRMNPPSQPSPPSGGTQQVGGAREQRQDPANADPAMAPLLQKLEEVRDRDSPAQLFQMFEKNNPRPPEKKGKDW